MCSLFKPCKLQNWHSPSNAWYCQKFIFFLMTCSFFVHFLVPARLHKLFGSGSALNDAEVGFYSFSDLNYLWHFVPNKSCSRLLSCAKLHQLSNGYQRECHLYSLLIQVQSKVITSSTLDYAVTIFYLLSIAIKNEPKELWHNSVWVQSMQSNATRIFLLCFQTSWSFFTAQLP